MKKLSCDSNNNISVLLNLITNETYSYANASSRKRLHDRFGGHAHYTSISGRTAEGRITLDAEEQSSVIQVGAFDRFGGRWDQPTETDLILGGLHLWTRVAREGDELDLRNPEFIAQKDNTVAFLGREEVGDLLRSPAEKWEEIEIQGKEVEYPLLTENSPSSRGFYIWKMVNKGFTGVDAGRFLNHEKLKEIFQARMKDQLRFGKDVRREIAGQVLVNSEGGTIDVRMDKNGLFVEDDSVVFINAHYAYTSFKEDVILYYGDDEKGVWHSKYVPKLRFGVIPLKDRLKFIKEEIEKSLKELAEFTAY